ncbi:hypothetical protein FS764_16510 [Agrobacterium vitis]|uniref:hypothetical protein n=1 Tax=Agrobacterium vitis TaxID=373 RepID=UPI0018D24BEC|nr:hypothetical protein [Agrobacterium vitis]MCF1468511.1 hypothetical protein [Agrobacterium vitis]
MTEQPLHHLEGALIDLRAMITLCLRLHETALPADLPTLTHDLITLFYIMLEKIEAAESGTNQLYRADYSRSAPPVTCPA